MRKSEHDVVIVGGSFAGLATAYFIEEGNVLILEQQKELGYRQRSTCATSVEWMERLNCKDAVLKTFDYLILHSSKGHSARIKLPQTFCTIDYKRFCTTLAGNLKNAEVLTGTRVLGLDGGDSNTVLSTGGRYTGRILVDASGWPGIGINNSRQKTRAAFGLEVETEFDGDTDSFHIYYGKRFIEKGYGWIVPIGKDRARVGLGGYSIFKPHEALRRFLREIEVEDSGSQAHGGYLPLFGLGEPVKEHVFVVGDACYHVLPTSGEGIRKAFGYAELCGRVITRVLQNEISLEEGLREYSEEVLKSKRFYDRMAYVQTLATYCPDWARNRIIRALSQVDRAKSEWLLVRYLNDDITSSKTRILKTVLDGILR